MRKRNLICSAVLTLVVGVGLGAASSAVAAPKLLPPTDGGNIRAFIVGIDAYTAKRRLQGAVADAQDLEASLKSLGVPDSNITVLLDQKASRKAFVAGMEKLINNTKKNDLVVISFAGHGAQLKEMHKNTKPDHLDEVYVLTQFDETVKTGYAERVHGPEIKAWLSKLDKKGAHVLFIADTCHGGGLTRSVDPRQSSFTYRVINIAEAAEDTLQPESTPADAMLTESSFSNVTFLAAVDRHSKAPEVRIDGQKTPRGALSYSVARALAGAADTAHKGSVTRRELFEYANQVVLQFAETRQHPYFEPRSSQGQEVVVFRTRSVEAPQPGGDSGAAKVTHVTSDQGSTGIQASTGPMTTTAPTEVRTEKRNVLKVAVINGAAAVKFGAPLSAGLETVSDVGQADLVWDARAKEGLSGGDVIARDVSAEEVPAMADRIAAGRMLATTSERRPLDIKLLPNDALHKHNEPLTLQVKGLKGKYFIIFNIAGNGTVQYLFPRLDEKSQINEDDWTMPFTVKPPYGLDQLVAISSNSRISQLEAELRELDNRGAAGRIPEVVKKYVDANPDLRIGLGTVATAP